MCELDAFEIGSNSRKSSICLHNSFIRSTICNKSNNFCYDSNQFWLHIKVVLIKLDSTEACVYFIKKKVNPRRLWGELNRYL